MLSVKRTFFIFLSFLLFASAVQAKDAFPQKNRIRLSGLVVDITGSGLPGVSVTIVGTELSTLTNKNGQFVFSKAPEGEVTVQMTKPGFQTVSRNAKIDHSDLMPETFTVELVPKGTTSTKGTLSGKGTVYVAYSEKSKPGGTPSGNWIGEAYPLPMLINGADPLDTLIQNDDPKRPNNPISIGDNQIMLYPPTAPQRSSYITRTGPVYHLTFGPDGKHLFTSGRSPNIYVHDETNKHETVGRVPLPGHQGAVTSLNRSDDGRWVLASVMSRIPGILAINSQSLQAEAFLPLDGLEGAFPLHVVSGPPEQLLVAVGKPDRPGRLLIVDAYTGLTAASVEVGSMPTSVATTPDKKWAYVVNSRSGNVTVVDLTNRKAVGVLAVGVAPRQAAVTPDGTRLLVTNSGSDTVSVVDTQKQRLSGFVRVGQGPVGIAVTPDSKTCYVSNRVGANISTIDLEKLEEVHVTNPLPHSQPFDLELRP